jgi:putative oxidoreductase
MLFLSLDRFRDLGLLILRIGVGVIFIVGGWPKISNPGMWPGLGSAMENLGITFWPTFWGFMAALAEFGGGILVILGFLFRPATMLLAFTMLVALIFHLKGGPTMNTFDKYSNALVMLFVFTGLILIGPGRFSVDAKLAKQV